ncbi:ArnT family glycosyltransferase [Parachitinimonas caeni]|uniref:4-amino-4-deoxy-L-arabinose transferase-like glycosyltransferase n=1 Tax=Parachitinimonas caeni TaxID=3031301 RepID=A0ABT7E2L5_9NEIS|nr:hypothetical protein [Parachitinimonas caeni]MDK2126562.1 hypothetical protein [Parachitinimonas caeni]
MLTYTPPHELPLPKPTEKPWLLLLLCLVWLIPGLIGREPLKPDEIVLADIIRHWLNGANWLVPQVAGQALVEHPPLFHWVAAFFARMSQGWLPIHDAARLASGFFTALALWGTGLTGRELIGRRHGRSAVLILLGSLGLLLPGHLLSPSPALLAGYAFAMYGLSLAPRLTQLAGSVLGISLAIMFMAGSLVEPMLMLASAWLVSHLASWSSRIRITTFSIALAVALPLAAAWPLALLQQAPETFEFWWQTHALGFFGGFGNASVFHPFGYYLKLLPWFAWPAWPIAAASLWMLKDRLDEVRIRLPLVLILCYIIPVIIAVREYPDYALPLLPPLAILGAAGLDIQRRGMAAFLNWFGVMTFGLLALLLWLGWLALHFGIPPRMAARAIALAPGFQPVFSPIAAVVGIVMSLVWLWAVSRRRPMGRQAVTNWAAGVTLVWGLAMAFWLPWSDARTSYRPLANQLSQVIYSQGNQCVSSWKLGDSQRGMLHYYAGIRTQRLEDTIMPRCPLLLVQADDPSAVAFRNWHMIWRGNRAGDETEHYVLFRQP